jgi:DNA mismatch repair ATPase MutL
MAKIITPPQIQDLSELLDVLVHPEKYVKYMQDMEAMRDAIIELLGTVKTRDEANELMAAAQRKYAEAEEVMDAAESQAKDLVSASAERKRFLDRQAEACAQEQAEAQKQIEQDRAAVAAHQAKVESAEKDLATREATIRDQDGAVRARSAILDQREAKLNKLKQAMGDAGI